MFTTWNKAIRRNWNLPTYSHRVLLCGLHKGKHEYDYVFKRFIKMYNSMKCKNTKMIYLTLVKNDKRSIISKKLQFPLCGQTCKTYCDWLVAPQLTQSHTNKTCCDWLVAPELDTISHL